MHSSFWQTLAKPIIGLAPMDGVTDAAMRFITKKYGNPPIVFTEFTSAEGIRAGALRLMKDFQYSEIERPVIGQVFGSDPDAFYHAAIVVAALGFDGLDINMGCPAKSVHERGAGAGLIKNPALAGEIIKASRRALEDWNDGISLKQAKIHETIITYVNDQKVTPKRSLLPLSVKTRIGFDKPVTKDWISHLLQFNLANISLHGRTLKQLYSGQANWDEIGQAAELTKAAQTSLLGNGDIVSLRDAHDKIKTYGLDGALIGRASFGNPWIFANSDASTEERLKVAVEHALKYEELFPGQHFLPMRKHLAWYAKGFERASQLRQKLVMSNSAQEVSSILSLVA